MARTTVYEGLVEERYGNGARVVVARTGLCLGHNDAVREARDLAFDIADTGNKNITYRVVGKMVDRRSLTRKNRLA
jgi:hypothetical protein